ncbi:hypothetical protein DRQ07_04740 [candidate division KSB1 bacterium]|nr:MAG: hypothetical protein DRQ07_04740 [candidate division KSB1 bacterium]
MFIGKELKLRGETQLKLDGIFGTIYNVQRILINQTDRDALYNDVCQTFEKDSMITWARISKIDDNTDIDNLSHDSHDNSLVSYKISYEKYQFGYLILKFSKNQQIDDDLNKVLNNVAKDIAFSVYKIENQGKRKKLEEALIESKNKLGERIKELRCLYAISRLIEKRGISLNEIYGGVIQFIPSAWQYPEITCAKIVLNDKIFKTQNYRDTHWKMTKEIYANAEQIGFLEVGYLEEKPKIDEGPFLKEERALIDTIAERLGKAAEYVQMQTVLHEQETSFRDLVENSLIGIVIIQGGQIVYMNSEQERISRLLPEMFNKMAWKYVHPDDVDRVGRNFKGLVSGGSKRIDIDFRFYPTEEKIEIKWVYCRISTVEYRGKDALLLNIIDVTRSKHMESLLRIKDKMASLGHVTAGIAHEIRNPLSGINIYINALSKIINDKHNSETINKIIEQMKSASDKIESVIRRVMDFSKPTEPKLIKINVNEPIREAINLSNVTLRKVGINILESLNSKLPECYADPILIEQVILNLITNSAEAMKEVKGEKKIEISSSVSGNSFIIRVADSGPGVPVQLKEKIFDPFYSTKDGNTGIGLSLCHRIISDHGGTMDVTTSKWGGAEFIIEIPFKKRDEK